MSGSTPATATMTKQERNKEFLNAYERLLADTDAKLICCLALTPEGETVAVMDMDNTVSEILQALVQYVEGLEKMEQGPK